MNLERTKYDYEELMARAVAKWLREPGHDQPCRYRSDIAETKDGRIIVMLANVNGNLTDYEYEPKTDRLYLMPPTAPAE